MEKRTKVVYKKRTGKKKKPVKIEPDNISSPRDTKVETQIESVTYEVASVNVSDFDLF